MLSYYHSLAPFLELFRAGLPILTYHKLGPRARGVRLKGLYVSEKLFARQLAELSEAGFSAVPPGLPLQSADERPRTTNRPGSQRQLAQGDDQIGSSMTLHSAALRTGTVRGPVPEGPLRIAITFDDGFCNVLRFGLEPLARHRFCAIHFLVADLIGKSNEWEQREGEAREPLMDAAQVRDWLGAGHDIGSHTCTHPWLTRLPLAQAREEIVSSKKKLEDLFARKILHFCYPYGDWNEPVRDLVEEAGYTTACTTQPGINTPGQPPFELKRFTARYPSRNLKAIWARFRVRRRRSGRFP
jgi:peptidoglycan/xylan/chitin deacetylase (PgdA/CDA1 family)